MTKLHERLRSERDKLRAVFESAALGILSVDVDGRILDANRAATTMLGLSHDSLVGTDLGGLFDEEAPPSTRSAAHEEAEGTDLDERRYDHPNGTTAWFNATRTWVRDAAGVVQLGTVVIEDITSRKHMECSLRHAQKLESVGRLAAGIAHEINTPIQFVSDNVHFLRDSFGSVVSLVDTLRRLLHAAGPNLDAECGEAETAADWDYLGEEVPKSILQTLDGLQRVATIVHSMKAFAHQERGEQTPTDLNAALTNTLVVAGHELKEVALAVTELGELPPVHCFRGDLNQVFLNLIVNAAHAIQDVVQKTGELGRITVATKQDGDSVVVSIADTGGGIPDEVASRMFEPFFTTKEVGRGTGQGLALARSIIVNKHGGSITFETHLGLGTTFTIRLPIAGNAVTEAAAA